MTKKKEKLSFEMMNKEQKPHALFGPLLPLSPESLPTA